MHSNATALRKTTILYVDNNTRARRLLGSILKDCGFSVVYAAESLEAVTQTRRAQPDLALIDYRLLEMSGAELAQKLKHLFPNLPIVMISGCAALPDEELAFVDAYFGRSSALDDLLATIRGLALANECGHGEALFNSSLESDWPADRPQHGLRALPVGDLDGRLRNGRS